MVSLERLRRCSDFSNKIFGCHKQDVRMQNTKLEGLQEQKGSDIEHKDTRTLEQRVALWGESRGLFAEFETEFEPLVVAEQRTYVAETRICHATGDLAGCPEEGEEFVAIEKDADTGSGAHHLGMEIHQSTEEGEVEHLLAGLEGVGAADGHTVEVGLECVVGIENEGGAAFFETETSEVFIEFSF